MIKGELTDVQVPMTIATPVIKDKANDGMASKEGILRHLAKVAALDLELLYSGTQTEMMLQRGFANNTSINTKKSELSCLFRNL